MGSVVEWIDNSWYSAYAKNWDDAIFRERIIAHIKPDSVVLDLGAGAGIVAQMNFKGLAQKVGFPLKPGQSLTSMGYAQPGGGTSSVREVPPSG